MNEEKTLGHVTPRLVRVDRVVRVEAIRGAGVKGDPVRLVVQIWGFDGNLIAEHDSAPESVFKEAESYRRANAMLRGEIHGYVEVATEAQMALSKAKEEASWLRTQLAEASGKDVEERILREE